LIILGFTLPDVRYSVLRHQDPFIRFLRHRIFIGNYQVAHITEGKARA